MVGLTSLLSIAKDAWSNADASGERTAELFAAGKAGKPSDPGDLGRGGSEQLPGQFEPFSLDLLLWLGKTTGEPSAIRTVGESRQLQGPRKHISRCPPTTSIGVPSDRQNDFLRGSIAYIWRGLTRLCSKTRLGLAIAVVSQWP